MKPREKQPAAVPPNLTGNFPAFPGHANLVEAARTIIAHYLAELARHEPGTIAGDPEALHDLRVALRRLRAALRLLRPFRLDDSRPNPETALRQFGQHLGAVRDLDVAVSQLDQEQAVQQNPDDSGLTAFRQYLLRQRDLARKEMIAALTSAEHADCRTLLSSWLAIGLASETLSPLAEAPWRDAFVKFFFRDLRRLRRQGEKLTPDTAERSYHLLRIRVRRLRYLIEFFAPGGLGLGLQHCHHHLVRLQEQLGRLQDLAMGRDLLLRFLIAEREHGVTPSQQTACLSLLEDRLERIARTRRDSWHAWRKLSAGKVFRRALAEIQT